jgi:hypothetical protein
MQWSWERLERCCRELQYLQDHKEQWIFAETRRLYLDRLEEGQRDWEKTLFNWRKDPRSSLAEQERVRKSDDFWEEHLSPKDYREVGQYRLGNAREIFFGSTLDQMLQQISTMTNN